MQIYMHLCTSIFIADYENVSILHFLNTIKFRYSTNINIENDMVFTIIAISFKVGYKVDKINDKLLRKIFYTKAFEILLK